MEFSDFKNVPREKQAKPDEKEVVVDGIEQPEVKTVNAKSFKEGLFALIKECDIGYEDTYKILRYLNENVL